MKTTLNFARRSIRLLGLGFVSLLFVAAESDLVTLTITNNSGYNIHYLYISSTSNTSWGEDHLGSNVLFDGEDFSVLINQATYDIKVVDEDGDECIRNGVPIQSSVNWTIGNSDWLSCIYDERNTSSSSTSSTANTIAFTIYNDTDWDMHYVYMSPSDEGWGDDKLGSSTILSSGSSHTLNLVPGTYDLKLIDEDSDECSTFGISVTSSTSWRVDNSFWLECI